MEIDSVLDNLVKAIQADPDQKIRKKSKVFWENLGIKHRTDKLIQMVQQAIDQHGLIVKLENGEFGKEDKDEKLTIRHVEIPVQEDEWFEKMS